jgi:ABC-2 type transport system ATP-binding protein
LVVVESLNKKFGDFEALKNVDLTIDDGEVFGLLGPNGAGKSTLLRVLLGFLQPTIGTATLDGLDCYHQRVDVHRRLSYLPGDARLYRTMKARRVLQLFCNLRSDANFQRGVELAQRLELDLNRWVGLMSTGMRQKLALVVCLAVDSPWLILDEPTANLDPTVRGQILLLVQEAKRAGRTVIFSSHVLSEIEEVCDRVGILKSGSLVHLESMSQLARQHRICARLIEGATVPDPPASIGEQLSIVRSADKIQIETPGELSQVLKWLSDQSLRDVTIEPVGLRSVYDRFHSAQLAPLAKTDSTSGRVAMANVSSDQPQSTESTSDMEADH